MRKLVLLFLLILPLLPGLELMAQERPKNLALVENPPLVPIEMRRPGFWISRHPAPDSLLMDAAQIATFNRMVQRKGDLGQIMESSPTIRANHLKKQINDCFNLAKATGKFTQDGSPPTADFWPFMKQQTNLTAIKASQNTRFAFPKRFTNQRLIPYPGILSKIALDTEFDYIQNSGFDVAEPLVIYHDSKDGNWVFGAGRASSGWFLKEDLVFLDRVAWLQYQQAGAFVISIADKSDLYLDEARTRYLGLIRLGTRLPLIAEHATVFEVLLPTQQSAYIAKRDLHLGFVPYTARNVYELAFSTLNAPYGWGDLNAEYDCSGLLKQLFQCFGIYLPRNGGAQYSAGHTLYEFAAGESSREREARIAEKGIPAQTMMRMPGHIMLYLGSVEGKSYALHALWGISRPSGEGKDEVIAANKTLVSDLSLSEGSKRKSLLLRLTAISAVKHE